MADDLNDIGSFEIFPFKPNWSARPTLNIDLARIIQRFKGTSHRMERFIDDAPERVMFAFNPVTREEVYDLIEFFVNRKGMHGRFWVRSPRREFTLKVDIGSGASALLVYRNGAVNQYQGHERIYLEMDNGDILTHHVQSITDDDINDRYSLNLATPTDRDLTTENFIGRLLLVRLDEDKLIMNFETDIICEVELTFVELVTEYDEI